MKYSGISIEPSLKGMMKNKDQYATAVPVGRTAALRSKKIPMSA